MGGFRSRTQIRAMEPERDPADILRQVLVDEFLPV